jgi:hypothetical protein
MKITKRQLKRIIKEEKSRILREQGDDMSTNTTPTNNEHHWPRVDWTNIETLADKWADAERKAWDTGDPSMNPDDENTAEMKKRWEDQVEVAAMDFEAELTKRVRKVSLEAMKEYTDLLIGGEYL